MMSMVKSGSEQGLIAGPSRQGLCNEKDFNTNTRRLEGSKLSNKVSKATGLTGTKYEAQRTMPDYLIQ